jgi:lipopolysaccharide transport system permease protein
MNDRVVRVRTAANLTPMTAVREAYRDRDVLFALTRRELSTRYRRSALGWAWSLVNPALTTIVYTFVFSVFLQVTPPTGSPSGISNFALYLICGLLPWTFFVSSIVTSSSALVGSAGIISKVRFAREHVVLAPVLALGFSLLIELGVVVLFLVVSGRNPLPYLPVLLVLIGLLAGFAGGLSLLLAPLSARYRDVPHLLGIGFMAWFYLTPITYPLDRVPEHVNVLGKRFDLHQVLLLNPMARFVQAIRNCLYDLSLPGATTFFTLCTISVVTLVLGYWSFVHRSNRLIEVL